MRVFPLVTTALKTIIGREAMLDDGFNNGEKSESWLDGALVGLKSLRNYRLNCVSVIEA